MEINALEYLLRSCRFSKSEKSKSRRNYDVFINCASNFSVEIIDNINISLCFAVAFQKSFFMNV